MVSIVPFKRIAVTRPLLFSFCLTFGTLLVALIVGSPHFETQDDVQMSFIVAGNAFADAPDPHMLFTHIAVGHLLAALYGTFPNFPWYGLYLIFVAFLSLTVLTYSLWMANTGRKQLVLILLLHSLVGLSVLCSIQFTKVAFLASLSGILLFLSLAQQNTQNYWSRSTAVCLVVIGSMIRYESAFLALIIAVPPLLYSICTSAFIQKKILAVGMIASALACFGLHYANQLAYQLDDKWSHFYEENETRAALHDYQRFVYGERSEPILDAVSWSKVELWTFAEGLSDQSDVFSHQRLKSLLELSRDTNGIYKSLRNMIRERIKDPDLIAGMTLLILLIFCLEPGLFRGGVVAATIGLAAGIAIALYFNRHLPARVYLCLLWACLCFTLFFTKGNFGSSKTLRAGRLIALLLVISVTLWRGTVRFQDGVNYQARNAVALEMLPAIGANPSRLHFLHWTFPYVDLISPLKPSPIPANFKAVAFGYVMLTPIGRQRLSDFGVIKLYPSLLSRPELLLLIPPRLHSLLSEFIARQYHQTIYFETVYEHPSLGESQFVNLHAKKVALP